MEELLVTKLEEMIEEQKNLYQKEIMDFKEVGHRFLRGEINANEFKASSGGMGVYAQRGHENFMIRLRVLCGVLDFNTFKLIKEFANEYGLEFVHLTTREAIQLHNLDFDDVINIMNRSLHSNLFTRGGGGNFPRNVSLSPLSGVEIGEAFDVTPYALFVNKYFLSRMNQYRLPRKFKIAFSNNHYDTANATIADLGFLAVNENGKNAFKVFIGGGLGVNGDISLPLGELVEPEDVLYHVVASIRLFTEEGDYENKGKARMRYIVKRLGKDAFLSTYKRILSEVKKTENLKLQIQQEKQTYETVQARTNDMVNLISQKQEGLYSVDIHPKGGILKTRDLNLLVEYLEKIPDVQIRLGMEENMIIRNLTLSQAEKLLELSVDFSKKTRLEQSVSCIGVPICQIGLLESQKLLSDIISYFEAKGMKDDLLPSVHISGCVNSCARHQVSEIGLQGKKKKIDEKLEEVYALHLGGITSESNTHLAKEYGDILSTRVPEFLYALALCLQEKKCELKVYRELYQEELESLLQKYLIEISKAI